MNRRNLCLFLVLIFLSCILFSPTSYAFATKAEQRGYIKVCVNGTSKNYVALQNEGNLYLRVEDISEITGYDLDIGDRIAYFKAGDFDTTTAVDIEFDGTTYAMGKEYNVNIIKNDEDTFLPLNKMLYLLHSQWCMEDDYVAVQPLPYTIIDFLGSNYESMCENKVNQTDLLVDGESELAHTLRSSLAAVFNDFDPMMFILWWPEEGISPALNKEYEEALLQLAVDDQDFLDSYGQSEIKKILEDSSIGQTKDALGTLKNVLDMPENLTGGLNDINELIQRVNELSKNHKSAKFDAYNDVSYMTPPRIKAWSQELEDITDTLEIINLLMNVSEVSQRSQDWGEDFISQISVLTDFDNMGYNTTITNRVKNVASNLIEEYQDPINASADEAALQATTFFLNKVFDESLFGKYFSIFNTGLAIAKTNENIKNSIDAADLSYMVDCLIKTEQIAMNEVNRSYSKVLQTVVNGNLTNQDIDRLRNCVMLSLRANLRNHAFIYYLNEKLTNDSNWRNSTHAQDIRNQIIKAYTLLCQVMETQPFDRLIVLDDFNNMYSDEYGLVRQRVTTDVFHEGELPLIDYDNGGTDIFGLLPSEFYFSSGAGGWATEITLNDDGTFNGQYHDSDMGDSGTGYSNGTVYICNFSGKFTMPQKINEYIYSMNLESLDVEETSGTVYYENDIRYIVSDPYGFDNADEFMVYLPGIAMSDLPEGFINWLYAFINVQATEILPCYGIYNVGGEEGFVAYDIGTSEKDSDSTVKTDNGWKEAYKSILRQHPESTPFTYGSNTSYIDTEYTVYDIDKNGIPELIVKEDLSVYYVYSFNGTDVIASDQCYWTYDDCLYEYEGNGIVVHGGGMGSMRIEDASLYSMVNNKLEWTETLISTEVCSFDELYSFLDSLTPINDFHPITDNSYLSN